VSRNSARGGYKTREPGSLKEAIADLVFACGGQRAASTLCRVSTTQMARYTDDDEAAHLPVDVALVLERHCRQPIVTNWLAAAQHQTLLPIALPELCVRPSEKLATIAEETGALMADAARAIEAGEFDAARAGCLRRECLETLSAVMALLASLPEAAQ
jgi:hypothetical protein